MLNPKKLMGYISLDSITRLLKKSANDDDARQEHPDDSKQDQDESEVITEEESNPKGQLPKTHVAATKERQSHLNSLKLVLLFSLAINLVLGNALSNLPSEIPIRRVPYLGNENVESIGSIPKHSVFTETAYLWRALNSWQTAGKIDADNNLWDYQNYFSEDFLDQLRSEYRDMKETGELNRKRMLVQLPRQLHEIDRRVVQKSENSWVVYLDMNLIETFLGKTIRDDNYRYSFLVEKVNTTFEDNPLGTKIVGFEKAPKKLTKTKTLVQAQ